MLISRKAIASTFLPARALRALRRLGPRGFAKLTIFNIKLLVTGEYREHRYVYDRAFDREHGVDTAGKVAALELNAPSAPMQHASGYEAADPDFFNYLLERTGISQRDKYRFVDIGAGKGRVMLLAALAGFRRVSGLELDPRLSEIAATNAYIFRQKHETELSVQTGDATTLPFEREPTVFFLNNPFDGELITRLLENIERAHNAAKPDVALIYMHSINRDLIRARRGWEEIDHGLFRNKRQFYAIFRWVGFLDPPESWSP